MTASPNDILQFIAWLLALLQLILALYVLGLNAWHTANRHVFAFLIVLALNTFALGSLTGAHNVEQARLPTLMLAITIPIIQPALLLTSVALLKPDFAQSRWGWLRWIPRLLIVPPLVLSLVDFVMIPRLENYAPLWYSGPDPVSYTGGYLPQADFTQGLLDSYVIIANFVLAGAATFLILLYLGIFDKSLPSSLRRLAWILLVCNAVGASASTPATVPLIQPLPFLLANAVFVVSYTYAVFLVMSVGFTETTADYVRAQYVHRGSLQVRLTWLALAIALPLLAGMAIFLTDRARNQLEIDAAQNLANINRAINASTHVWLDDRLNALNGLASLEEIQGMQPTQQETVLKAAAASLPGLRQVFTVDYQGRLVARGAGSPDQMHENQPWFQQLAAGAPFAYQPFLQRDLWKPDLLVASPILNSSGQAIGAVALASNLDEIARQLQQAPLGTGGQAYLVDQDNRLLIHSTWTTVEDRTRYALQDLATNPPIAALRQGQQGAYQFTDENGQTWRANLALLPNGWGVVVQVPEAELLAPIRSYQAIAWSVLGIGALVLFGLTWLSVRQSMQPVRNLTETAAAIAAGDLSRSAETGSEDELGLLAQVFNSMTDQLRQLIGGLESQVDERTQAMQRRAVQLQVAAEVARQATAVERLEDLLQNAVQLISGRFGHYHTGIFLLSRGPTPELASEESRDGPDAASPSTLSDRVEVAADRFPTTQYAILQAASSPGGQRMLQRGHRLRVGETGIVGYVAATNEPRIALDVGADAVFFNNPDLPETRSEMALPLRARGKVIGVLDVQSTEEDAFDEQDVEIMQILADQLAVAIENLRLLEQSRTALQELEAAYGQRIRRHWRQRLAGRQLAFTYNPTGVRPVQSAQAEQADSVHQVRQVEEINHTDGRDDSAGDVLRLPIELRGQRLGSLVLRRSGTRSVEADSEHAKEPPDGGSSTRTAERSSQATWSQQEIDLAQETLTQVALALENARLLEEIQARASQESLINLIIGRVQSSLELESVLQMAVQEIGKSIRASKVQIRLGPPPTSGNLTDETALADEEHSTATLGAADEDLPPKPSTGGGDS